MKKTLIALLASTVLGFTAFAADSAPAPKSDKCCGEKACECSKGDKSKCGTCDKAKSCDKDKKSCDKDKGCSEQKK